VYLQEPDIARVEARILGNDTGALNDLGGILQQRLVNLDIHLPLFQAPQLIYHSYIGQPSAEVKLQRQIRLVGKLYKSPAIY
jgi:hypothetical protein